MVRFKVIITHLNSQVSVNFAQSICFSQILRIVLSYSLNKAKQIIDQQQPFTKMCSHYPILLDLRKLKKLVNKTHLKDKIQFNLVLYA